MQDSLMSPDVETNTGVGRSIAELYTSEGLEVPMVPQVFEADLRDSAPLTFGTRKIDRTLYELSNFVAELEAGKTSPYLLFGFAGHGFVSQAVHYYLVTDHVAVFIQSRWANALSDPETDRLEYLSRLSLLKVLLKDVDAAVETGKFPFGRHLVVVLSDFQQSRWGWHVDTIEWHQSGEFSLLNAIVQVRRLARKDI